MRIYIAGPMRTLPEFNFPAFYEKANELRVLGHEPVNPAELDAQAGYPLHKLKSMDERELEAFAWEAIMRDLNAIFTCDAIAVLPGWEASRGVAVEVAMGRFLGIPILDAETLEHLPTPEPRDPQPGDVLEEALRITRGDRNNAYGPPDQDFRRTASMWSAILGCDVEAKDVALCMIALKISRATWMSRRDNWTDIAGYARCGWLCEGGK